MSIIPHPHREQKDDHHLLKKSPLHSDGRQVAQQSSCDDHLVWIWLMLAPSTGRYLAPGALYWCPYGIATLFCVVLDVPSRTAQNKNVNHVYLNRAPIPLEWTGSICMEPIHHGLVYKPCDERHSIMNAACSDGTIYFNESRRNRTF